MLYQLSYSRTRRRGKGWGMVDLNHRRRSRRVYSPFPLTTRAIPLRGLLRRVSLSDIKTVGRTVESVSRSFRSAGGGTRTRNLQFTKLLLCQLSYASERSEATVGPCSAVAMPPRSAGRYMRPSGGCQRKSVEISGSVEDSWITCERARRARASWRRGCRSGSLRRALRRPRCGPSWARRRRRRRGSSRRSGR